MSGSLLIGLPSKGRLQEACAEFFERAGLRIEQGGGARDYRGRFAAFDGAEVVFLSSGDIAGQLASGAVHFGVTGEDLIRENVRDASEKLELLSPLGFGHADVVVAVPRAWIDVRTMADLADVAADFRSRHARRLRVATKYLALTRAAFARHGISDYLIVESPGATEGAPAAGTADIIVDITTTGATLAANALKTLEDGKLLKSEANLVASLVADWSSETRGVAARLLARVSAEAKARRILEVRACADEATLALACARYDASLPFAGSGAVATLHVPRPKAHACAEWLSSNGAEAVTLAPVTFVFTARNELMDTLERRLG